MQPLGWLGVGEGIWIGKDMKMPRCFLNFWTGKVQTFRTAHDGDEVQQSCWFLRVFERSRVQGGCAGVLGVCAGEWAACGAREGTAAARV